MLSLSFSTVPRMRDMITVRPQKLISNSAAQIVACKRPQRDREATRRAMRSAERATGRTFLLFLVGVVHRAVSIWASRRDKRRLAAGGTTRSRCVC